MEMKMKAHCGGDELQIGTNTKVWGKLDGDHNTNRKKKKTPKALILWFDEDQSIFATYNKDEE
jgi:hypothetical protein